jgi:hypothetical protein
MGCAMHPVIYAAFVIASLSGSALAQGNTNQPPRGTTSSTTGMTKQQAPVGHRQPKAKDLPANVLQNEQGAAATDKERDKRLTICKGC